MTIHTPAITPPDVAAKGLRAGSIGLLGSSVLGVVQQHPPTRLPSPPRCSPPPSDCRHRACCCSPSCPSSALPSLSGSSSPVTPTAAPPSSGWPRTRAANGMDRRVDHRGREHAGPGESRQCGGCLRVPTGRRRKSGEQPPCHPLRWPAGIGRRHRLGPVRLALVVSRANRAPRRLLGDFGDIHSRGAVQGLRRNGGAAGGDTEPYVVQPVRRGRLRCAGRRPTAHGVPVLGLGCAVRGRRRGRGRQRLRPGDAGQRHHAAGALRDRRGRTAGVRRHGDTGIGLANVEIADDPLGVVGADAVGAWRARSWSSRCSRPRWRVWPRLCRRLPGCCCRSAST